MIEAQCVNIHLLTVKPDTAAGHITFDLLSFCPQTFCLPTICTTLH